MRHFIIFRLLCLLFLMTVQNASAYHIAGGDFTYKWIGGNDFEVRLKLYRDCSNTQAAGFDNAIRVSVYERGSNIFLKAFDMNLSIVDSLHLAETGCVQPPEVCLQYGIYSEVINLPDHPGGYYIIW